jgi:hypothetical protein
VSISTSGFTFAFGTVSDELNLIKTLSQEGNHSGGLHRAVHEGLDTASDVTWLVSKDGILPSFVQGYSYRVRKKGVLETGVNACARVKARCAYYILDQTRNGIETDEIEARVSNWNQKFLVTETGGGRKIYEVTQDQTGGSRTAIRSDQHHSAVAVPMSRQWRRSASAPLKYRPALLRNSTQRNIHRVPAVSALTIHLDD